MLETPTRDNGISPFLYHVRPLCKIEFGAIDTIQDNHDITGLVAVFWGRHPSYRGQGGLTPTVYGLRKIPLF